MITHKMHKTQRVWETITQTVIRVMMQVNLKNIREGLGDWMPIGLHFNSVDRHMNEVTGASMASVIFVIYTFWIACVWRNATHATLCMSTGGCSLYPVNRLIPSSLSEFNLHFLYPCSLCLIYKMCTARHNSENNLKGWDRGQENSEARVWKQARALW